jgi:hypothetical protein
LPTKFGDSRFDTAPAGAMTAVSAAANPATIPAATKSAINPLNNGCKIAFHPAIVIDRAHNANVPQRGCSSLRLANDTPMAFEL